MDVPITGCNCMQTFDKHVCISSNFFFRPATIEIEQSGKSCPAGNCKTKAMKQKQISSQQNKNKRTTRKKKLSPFKFKQKCVWIGNRSPLNFGKYKRIIAEKEPPNTNFPLECFRLHLNCFARDDISLSSGTLFSLSLSSDFFVSRILDRDWIYLNLCCSLESRLSQNSPLIRYKINISIARPSQIIQFEIIRKGLLQNNHYFTWIKRTQSAKESIESNQ